MNMGNDLFSPILFIILFVMLGISFTSVQNTLAYQSERIDKIYEMLAKEALKDPILTKS